MATIKTLSPADLAKARRAGFKRKAPKKPKASASLTTLENWVIRHNQWCDDAREKIKAALKREQLKSHIKKLR